MRKQFVNEFFSARSMLTPGICGATTMSITSSLVSAFQLPGNYVALSISLVMGLIVIADERIKMPGRLVYYVLNSLVIFSMAFGLNAASVQAFNDSQESTRLVMPEGTSVFFQPWHF